MTSEEAEGGCWDGRRGARAGGAEGGGGAGGREARDAREAEEAGEGGTEPRHTPRVSFGACTRRGGAALRRRAAAEDVVVLDGPFAGFLRGSFVCSPGRVAAWVTEMHSVAISLRP